LRKILCLVDSLFDEGPLEMNSPPSLSSLTITCLGIRHGQIRKEIKKTC
jgi:hypothetical protein